MNTTCTDLRRQDDIVRADKHAVESAQHTQQISLEAVLKLVASSASKQEPGLDDKLEHVLQRAETLLDGFLLVCGAHPGRTMFHAGQQASAQASTTETLLSGLLLRVTPFVMISLQYN